MATARYCTGSLVWSGHGMRSHLGGTYVATRGAPSFWVVFFYSTWIGLLVGRCCRSIPDGHLLGARRDRCIVAGNR